MTMPISGQVDGGFRSVGVDVATRSLQVIDYPHYKIHAGNAFFVMYSVADLGALTTPNDTMTLTWTTPDTTRWGHFNFIGRGTSGWRVRLIEAPSGGAGTQTEQLPILNLNRNSEVASTFIALDSTAGEVSYDATLATGGTTLFDEYILGATTGAASGSADTGSREEIMLKQNTKYQLSMFGTDNTACTLLMKWYEQISKT